MTADPHTGEPVRTNDSEVPIHRHYGPLPAEPSLREWITTRAGNGPPYRPRAMVYTGQGSPEMTAERVRMLQDVGAESVLLACDLPAQLGFDPDHRLARAQVGRAGVSCGTLDDLRTICAPLDLEKLDSLGMLANSVGHVGLPMVREVLAERGAEHVRLVMQNDPLKEFTARGTELFSPEQAVRIACDTVGYAIEEGMPGYAMAVCSNHYDVAGAGPVRALGIALANGITYLEELVRRGHSAVEAAKRIMLFVNERSDLFVCAAVFRVARALWGEILRERFSVRPDEIPPVALMGYAHGLETSNEPLVNVPRCTLSVAAATLGGVDYLCAASYDEALRVPSTEAAALAVRTLRVVGAEHGITASIDPLAGGHKFTDVEAWVREQVVRELDRIEERGGALACLYSGYIAELIDERRGTRQRQLDSGEREFIGENTAGAPRWQGLFAGSTEPVPGLDVVEGQLRERVRKHKEQHAGPALDGTLERVRLAARGTGNLLPPSAEALRAGATIEQIIEATRSGFREAG
ncbi:MAG: hypothetical protein GEU98_01170 [Pseudonocardiaceae bacterium]|nr:hypothetical protein [Pseudonocardiaceae bacterium]